MKHWSGWLSAPVLLLLGALAFWNLQQLEQDAPLKPERAQNEARYLIKNAQWTRLDLNGAPEMRATAQNMSWFDDQSAHMVQPEFQVYSGGSAPDAQGCASAAGAGCARAAWRLTAPEGQLPRNSRNVLLTGTVLAVGHWPDGAELGFNTARLWLDAEKKLLRTDADVSLEGAGRHILATGMSADWQAKHLQLLSNVQAQYNIPGTRPGT